MVSNLFSEKLKTCRNETGLTQEQVAEKLNVTRQTISKWENGVNEPDIYSIVCLCDLYNTTLDHLLREDTVLIGKLAYKERSYKKLAVSVFILVCILIVILSTVSFQAFTGIH